MQQPFTEAVKAGIRRYTSLFYDGTQSLGQLLKEIQAQDPAAAREIIHHVIRQLLDAREAPDQAAHRQELIQRQRELDRVDFLQGITPAIPEDSTFQAFNRRPRYPTVGQALDAVLAWCGGSGPPLLTLLGAPGTGKSHLARAGALHLHREGRPAAYRVTPGLVSELMLRLRDRSVDLAIQEFCEVPWLVLDEFGPSPSDWAMGVLDQLVDARWANHRRTLFTTNLTRSELPARIASRIGDLDRGRVVVVIADDYRRTRGGPGPGAAEAEE